MSRSRISLSLLVLALLALPVSAEVFHVTLTNGSVIDTAYQPQQASWDPNMVLLLAETGNWVGFHKDEIDSISADDPAQGFGIRISDKAIALGFSPNDLPTPEEGGGTQQANNDRFYALAERSLALAEQQQNYSIQQGVSTEQTQGIPSSFGNFGGNGINESPLGGLVTPAVLDSGSVTPASLSPVPFTSDTPFPNNE